MPATMPRATRVQPRMANAQPHHVCARVLVCLHAAKAAPQARAALLRHQSVRSANHVQGWHGGAAAAQRICIRRIPRQEARNDDCKAQRVLW